MNFSKTFSAEERKKLLSRVPELKRTLLDNCSMFRQYPEAPLLKAGDVYAGIWLEHNQDNLFLAEYAPESAWASQDAFMRYQREDGLLPFALPLKFYDSNDYFYKNPVCFGQVQSVYSFARCAFEIAKKTNRPEKDFEKIYDSGVRYDAWFGKYRDHGSTGLSEMFCEFDTGHDNDPRVMDDNIPCCCPDKDAKNMPDIPVMPILSVDLSAVRFGARAALAEIADFLGRKSDAEIWRNKAEETRLAIRKYLFDPEDCFYYDRDPRGFRKYRTEHVTRLFLNGVLTRAEFDAVYDRYFTVPGKEFLPDFPIPAVSVDDPHFVKACPKNCWGSNSQALTALRAILWMDRYGRPEDLDRLLARWLRAILDHPESTFQQEINPFTGAPVGEGVFYTPTILVYLEGVKRLFNERT